MKGSMKARTLLGQTAVYAILTFFALVMIFPFLVMLFTSFKQVEDTYRFPPRLLPKVPVSAEVEGFDEPLPLYIVEDADGRHEYVLIERSVRVGDYAAPDNQHRPRIYSRDTA